MEYTLTFSEGAQGWASFYSYIPDWMIGMNNNFYSFNNGNLYKHNSHPIRNNFYGQQYTSKIRSVFNDEPLVNKLFKTLNLEGDAAWGASLTTDVQNTGYIDEAWFEKKEQSFFAFVRNSGSIPASSDEYVLRSINGIGRGESLVTLLPSLVEVNFSISPLVSIGNIISCGDTLYYAIPPYTNPIYAGEVYLVTVDIPNGINKITVQNLPLVTIPIVDAYFMFVKNSVAESHGVLGHYCIFELENDSTSHIELFAVESSVMKSYP